MRKTVSSLVFLYCLNQTCPFRDKCERAKKEYEGFTSINPITPKKIGDCPTFKELKK